MRNTEGWYVIRYNKLYAFGNWEGVIEESGGTQAAVRFQDGDSAMRLVCAGLRHMAGIRQGNKKQMNIGSG